MTGCHPQGRLSKRPHGNPIGFNNTKCKVLHLGWGNPQYQHSLGHEQIESSLGEKDLGLLVDERLDMTQPCALTAQRDKGVLGCLQSSVASRAREGILSLCSSLVRPLLQCCFQLWDYQHRKDMDLLEQAQRRPAKLSEG
ncbi:hypothetical protein HGM15179_008708 [Zosterops borbonicus]|uniref:Uncharacterized protein n=1 Tax=Zosterops borbonicus TaxID=364589 RepID=A0A8K1GIA6_9PASS|nr:hypothetical protein HGM15179_008708 [Zosterops borbonicus]